MKRQIKLVHVVTTYHSVITILDSKLRALNNFDDLNVSVVSSPSVDKSDADPAVRFIPLSISRAIKPFSDLMSVWRLWRILKREKFDIVHSHTAKAGIIAALAAKMARVPFICHTYHGLPFFDGQNRAVFRIYRLLETIACKFRDHLFTQNKRNLPACVRLIGSETKVSYEGNGVDASLLTELSRRQLPQAQKDYPSQGGVKLLLLSRLEPVKRVHDFLMMVDKLRQMGLNVSCVVAGAGPLEQSLRNQLVAMQLQNCVNMIGFTNYPHGLIAASDVVLLCSEKEGIPRSIMEAMALQKPVVTTDVLGTQELVVDGQTGFLVPLGNVTAMAEKIKLLVQNPNLREKMGLHSLERVNEYFNDTAIAKMLYGFYVSRLSEEPTKKRR